MKQKKKQKKEEEKNEENNGNKNIQMSNNTEKKINVNQFIIR